MRTLKKNQLKLEKEVVTSLSENELFQVKGGILTDQNTTLCPTNFACPIRTDSCPSIGCTKQTCSNDFGPCLNTNYTCDCQIVAYTEKC